MVIELQGFAARDEKKRKKLSEKRAEAIRDALVKLGINKTRLIVIGFGDPYTKSNFKRSLSASELDGMRRVLVMMKIEDFSVEKKE